MIHSDLTNQEKLEEIYKLTVENNHMLHKIQSRDRIAIIIRVVYWLAILGALGGAYYYIKPFFEAVSANKSRADGVLQQFEQLRSQFPETKAFQHFLENLRTPQEATSTEEQP